MHLEYINRYLIFLFFASIISSLGFSATPEKQLIVRSLSLSQSIYFTLGFEKSTGIWPFRHTTVEIPKDSTIVYLKPEGEQTVFFNANSISLSKDGEMQTINIPEKEIPILIFARFSESLTDLKNADYEKLLKNKFVTPFRLDVQKVSEIFADVLVEPGFEHISYPVLVDSGNAAHVVNIFNEAKILHPTNIDINNPTPYETYAAAYQCHSDAGDITQTKRCIRLNPVLTIKPHSSEIMSDIMYDVRARDYQNEPGKTHFAYLIISRLKDDLLPERDLRDSAMRFVLRSTRRAYNAIYDLIKNPTTRKLWLNITLNGIYIADSRIDLSRVSKALKDTAVSIASWVHWRDYEKWAKPFKNIINEIAKDPYRLVDSNVRQGRNIPKEEADFLKQRKRETDKAFLNLGISGSNLPVVAACLSGGGYRAMLSSFGFIMGLSEIGVFDTLTYQAGLSGSSWFLAKMMAEAQRQHNVNFERLRSDLIERVQEVRYPKYGQQVQIAYMLAPLFKKFMYYQPITPVDLYGELLGATLLDLGSPNYRNPTFSSFASIIEDGKLPMPIGTAISKTNVHWFELTPYEVGSYELSMFIPSFSFGRTYLKGAAIDNAPELTLHNEMGFMGSAFALKGMDFLRHLGPDLSFLPSSLGDTLNSIVALSNEAGLFSVADLFLSDKAGVTFDSLKDILKGTSAHGIGYWQQLYDSMPYGFVFISKPELGKNGAGFGQQSAIPAGITPNPFYQVKSEELPDDELFFERYVELRDAGIDFNLPFPPLLAPERNVNVIFAFDASSDILKNGASVLRFAEDYAKKHGLSFPNITDADFNKASTNNIAIIGDPDDQNALTIVYMSLLKNSNLLGKYGQYSPLDDPNTSTFNFSYPKSSSSMLIDSVRKNVLFYKDEILDVLRRKSGLKNQP